MGWQRQQSRLQMRRVGLRHGDLTRRRRRPGQWHIHTARRDVPHHAHSPPCRMAGRQGTGVLPSNHQPVNATSSTDGLERRQIWTLNPPSDLGTAPTAISPPTLCSDNPPRSRDFTTPAQLCMMPPAAGKLYDMEPLRRLQPANVTDRSGYVTCCDYDLLGQVRRGAPV